MNKELQDCLAQLIKAMLLWPNFLNQKLCILAPKILFKVCL